MLCLKPRQHSQIMQEKLDEKDHFQAAAKYAMNSNGQACVALEIECIALTFVRLGDVIQAKQNAEESLRLYNLEAPGPFINESIRRVSELVKILEAGGGQENR